MTRRILLVAVAAATVLVAGLVALAAAPTGEPTVDAVVAADARIAARASVGDVRLLLVAQRGDRSLVVAYRTGKGWFGLQVDPPPEGARVAWTSTRGGDDVPALSAVYGTADGASVEVRWADGRVTDARVATDGSWLAARAGRVRVATVVETARDGAVVRREPGP